MKRLDELVRKTGSMEVDPSTMQELTFTTKDYKITVIEHTNCKTGETVLWLGRSGQVVTKTDGGSLWLDTGCYAMGMAYSDDLSLMSARTAVEELIRGCVCRWSLFGPNYGPWSRATTDTLFEIIVGKLGGDGVYTARDVLAD